MKYINDFLLTVAYLNGERSIQSATTAIRTNFVHNTLKEVYRAYPWPFAQVNLELTIASGIASLPSTFDYQHKLSGYYYSGDQQINVDEINFIDQTGYIDGDNKFWLEVQSDGTYLIKTKDSTIGSIFTKFQSKAPEVNASIGTPYEEDGVVAQGVRRYIKLAQDPNADVSQDEALFQKRLTESIAAVQLSRPKRKMRKLSNANNYRVGGGFE
ncbi:MAG TPA: hypothetical protein PKV66_01125 [Candidatus Pelethenecus sp.]|nr:hypothetical protein [Candidatus Pelethenecus sp.]